MRQGVSGVSVAMETGKRERQSAESGSYAFAGATWTPSPRLARIRSPSQSTWLSSLAYSESFHHGFGGRRRFVAQLSLPPLPEPQLLRLRPTSLRTQDISYLLTGVFRNLYTAEVIGEEVSSNLIKARGSEDARHEEFVDQLQQVTGYRAPLASPCAHPGDGGVASAAVQGTQGATQPLGKCQPLSGAAAVPGTGYAAGKEQTKSVPPYILRCSGRTLYALLGKYTLSTHIRCISAAPISLHLYTDNAYISETTESRIVVFLAMIKLNVTSAPGCLPLCHKPQS